MKKRILITGGTGFIGQMLCRTLSDRGWSLTVLSRQAPDTVKGLCGPVQVIHDLAQTSAGPGFDAVINLAGEGIADKRWSGQRKQVLRDSRIALSRKLVRVMESWTYKPGVLVSGSAVGVYGDQGDQIVTEDTSPNIEFTHELCRDWEQAALEAEILGVRVCLSRTGVVTGSGGGFLQRMLLPFKLGLGGKLGSGEQYMPWVHRDDVVAALVWMLDNDQARGAYNVVSPQPVTNAEFARTLAQVLNRPAILPAPAFALRVMLGEMARLLLTGQRAVPDRLEREGFRFTCRELVTALRASVQ
jgi:uncharacterized protein (TIGR01777 family)